MGCVRVVDQILSKYSLQRDLAVSSALHFSISTDALPLAGHCSSAQYRTLDGTSFQEQHYRYRGTGVQTLPAGGQPQQNILWYSNMCSTLHINTFSAQLQKVFLPPGTDFLRRNFPNIEEEFS